MDEQRRPLAIVVDDNATILLHASDVLYETGFDVYSFGGSEQALEWFDRNGDETVLLVTNVIIPGPLNGFALARFVADLWSNVAILVTSGHVRPSRASDMPEGAIFLPKPYNDADLLRDVRRLLEARQSPALAQLGSLPPSDREAEPA